MDPTITEGTDRACAGDAAGSSSGNDSGSDADPIPKASQLDLDLADRYQSFSAELLRLSLVGIAAFGFLAKEIVAPSGKSPPVDPSVLSRLLESRGSLSFALAAFAIAAACALAHRYCSTDAVAHLAYMSRKRRRALAGDPKAAGLAESERDCLHRDLRWSGRFLIASSISLALGIIVAAATFASALWPVDPARLQPPAPHATAGPAADGRSVSPNETTASDHKPS